MRPSGDLYYVFFADRPADHHTHSAAGVRDLEEIAACREENLVDLIV